MRAALSTQDLSEIKKGMEEMRSQNRWPKDQQSRYLAACEKTQPRDPSINRRTCECMLEVMMEKHKSFGDLAKDLANGGGTADEQTKGLFGFCLVAFGN